MQDNDAFLQKKVPVPHPVFIFYTQLSYPGALGDAGAIYT
jgi:hypothetical protein